MPRRDLTLAEKVSYLDRIKQQPPNTTRRRLAEITGLPKTTISRLIKLENELREEWSLCEGGRGLTQKRKRVGKDPNVDDALNEWFSIATGRSVRISGPMLKCKAEELARMLGHAEFKATDGWLSRWKARRNIKFRRTDGEKESTDGTGVADWKSTKLSVLLEKFAADDVYNAAETGLYYRATPDGSLSYKPDALSGSDKAMDRVTVLCCSNMSGTDKRKLLVIGKGAKPRCFKGLRMGSLPVLYRANKNAWMTSELFEEWLKDWDRELQHQLRKVLLLLDNCIAHSHFDTLQNIQLEFLPPRTTLVQPMDMGIIKDLKILYRSRLANYILEAIEDGLLSASSTATEVSATVNIFQAVTFVADSWRKVSCETVQNCFSLCGFRHFVLDMDEEMLIVRENEDGNVVLRYVENCEEFLSVDNELPCYDVNADYDSAIVARIPGKHVTAPEDQESDDDVPNGLIPVTTQDARKCIETLRHYFMQEGSEGSPIPALDVCADFVQVQSVNRIRKTNWISSSKAD